MPVLSQYAYSLDCCEFKAVTVNSRVLAFSINGQVLGSHFESFGQWLASIAVLREAAGEDLGREEKERKKERSDNTRQLEPESPLPKARNRQTERPFNT